MGNHGSHLPEHLKFQSVNVLVVVKDSLEDMRVHLSESQPDSSSATFVPARDRS